MDLKKLTFYQIFGLFIVSGTIGGCSKNLPTKSKIPNELTPPSFVVVTANSTFLRSNSERLFMYDRIYPSDTIELVNGHLIAVDSRGSYFELEGDTILRVSEIIEQMPKVGYKANSGEAIDKLYSTSEPFGIKASDLVIDGPREQGIKFIFPPSAPFDFSFNQSVCLMWASTSGQRIDSGNFQVEIKSIFDEIIGNMKAVSGKFEFDPKIYNEGTIIVEVHGLEDQQISTKPMGIRFYGNIAPYATPCHANTALEHLLLGLTYESNQLTLEARGHYELAASLSTQPFYQLMLINFKKRNRI